jgi:hypothetical protein
MHEDPIPSLYHFLGNLGIARFIRIPEVPATYPYNKKKETETQENKDLNPGLSE